MPSKIIVKKSKNAKIFISKKEFAQNSGSQFLFNISKKKKIVEAPLSLKADFFSNILQNAAVIIELSVARNSLC